MDKTKLIRQSRREDITAIMDLIAQARRKMQAEGNTHQWVDGHPSQADIEADIKRGVSYVITSDKAVPIATFALIPGPDPTYAQIYDGAWLDDNPYFVIHRVASAEGVHGIMRAILGFAGSDTNTIRIDTHRDNKTMRALLSKYGFTYCGIIHLLNGDERLAYQRTCCPIE